MPPAKENRRRDFVRALAQFFTSDTARRSVDLEMGKAHAREWAKLRTLTPIMGYVSEDEAFRILTEFFYGSGLTWA